MKKIIILLIIIGCNNQIKKSNFEICIDGLKQKSSWAFIGDITTTAADSQAVKECAELGKIELRSRLVKAHGKGLNDKNKLLFIMGTQTKRTIWEK